MFKLKGAKKLSPQTASFIVLFAIAVVGTYISLVIATKLQNRELGQDLSAGSGDYTSVSNQQNSNGVIKTASAEIQDPVVDTADWKTYTDARFGFSFKYAPDWKVKPAVQKGDYYVIEIDPGKKFYNIKIYISEKGYYAMDGLPTKEETIDGRTALNVSNMLYGIKSGSYYYTFDVGLSVSLRPSFRAMVHTVNFTE